jgi:hypothetical protein
LFQRLFQSLNPLHQYRLCEGGPGGGGGGNPTPPDPNAPPPAPSPVDWYGGLPDDLKTDTAIAAVKDKPIGDVVTSYRDLSKQVAEFSPPATPKEYGIGLPASLSEAAKDPAVAAKLTASLDAMLSRAHALKMPKAIAQAFVEDEAKQALADLDAAKKERTAADKALRGKWGNEYDERAAVTTKALEILPANLKAKIEKAGLGSDPDFIELIYTIGEAQSEGRLIKGGSPGATKDLATRLYGHSAAG